MPRQFKMILQGWGKQREFSRQMSHYLHYGLYGKNISENGIKLDKQEKDQLLTFLLHNNTIYIRFFHTFILKPGTNHMQQPQHICLVAIKITVLNPTLLKPYCSLNKNKQSNGIDSLTKVLLHKHASNPTTKSASFE